MKKIISLLFLLNCGPFYSQVNLSSSLTACYALDGNGTEPISALTATLVGPTATVNRFNTPNSALYFNGNSQYIALPDDPLLKPAEAISFSCWIYGNSQTNFYLIMTQNSLSGNFEAFELCTDPSLTFMARKCGPGGVNQVNSSTPYVAGNWYHLAVTIDNSFVKLYVNGQLEASTASTFNGFDYVTGNKVYLGGTNSWYDSPFNGTMDNVRFYNRTITAAEVLALYNTDPTCISNLAPVAIFSVSGNACAGSTVQLTDNSTNNPTQWSWNVNGGITNNTSIQNPVYTFPAAGVYTAVLLASNAAGSSTTSAVFTINPAPQIVANVSPTLVCRNFPVALSATGASSYYWMPPGLTTQTLSYLAVNTQTVFVTGTDAHGCTATTSMVVKVSICDFTGIAEEGAEESLKAFYDEPMQSIRILRSDQSPAHLSLYSSDLRLLFYEKAWIGARYDLPSGDLKGGIYFLILENEQRQITKKIFVPN